MGWKCSVALFIYIFVLSFYLYRLHNLLLIITFSY